MYLIYDFLKTDCQRKNKTIVEMSIFHRTIKDTNITEAEIQPFQKVRLGNSKSKILINVRILLSENSQKVIVYVLIKPSSPLLSSATQLCLLNCFQ